MHVHWLIRGHMPFNKQTVSCPEQATFAKVVTILMSEGNFALLPASATDHTMTKGGMIMMQLMFTSSAWQVFAKLTVFFFLFFHKIMTDPSGNSEFCFPRISRKKIHCFLW